MLDEILPLIEVSTSKLVVGRCGEKMNERNYTWSG